MAFALTWKIEFGDCTGLTDITSSVQSLSITANAQLGAMGRSTAAVTIENFDGAFTPGGSGVYASTDWFSKALVITSTSGANTGTSFVGIITDFDIRDVNAKESYVTISGVDWLSVAGRSTTGTTSSQTVTIPAAFTSIVTGGTGFGGLPNRQTMGAVPFALCGYTVAQDSTSGINSQLTDNYGGIGTAFYLGDGINNIMIASGVATLFSTDYIRTTSKWTWAYTIQGPGNKTQNLTTYSAVGTGSALTSGQLPYVEIDTGFTLNTLINSAKVGTLGASDSSSIEKYGSRSVQFSTPGNASAAYNVIPATYWVTRYSTPRFIPTNITFSYSSLKSSAVDDGVAMLQFMRLLWPQYAFWNQMSVAYKGAGQSSEINYQTIGVEMTINATPSDTSISMQLLSAVDNLAFILDSSTMGILDTNRLG
ncbi:hypothetical protein UFOVP295_19 [uncultured Caudovirales phage]|uniref:Uncharacterized protein n=1 Tax=uncultured Caudovirales phage TaxID=2100421 RepID=A0A6J5LNR2_9CAUD|nr:hypothetical protein UFOVP295_19 [uncultured Caudovirales phage]